MDIDDNDHEYEVMTAKVMLAGIHIGGGRRSRMVQGIERNHRGT